jgi:hypothetical protein
MYGLGILDKSAGLPLSRTYLFASMMVLVLDGRTRDVVRIERVNDVANPIDWLMSGSALVQQVDNSWWPAPGQVAGDSRIKSGIQALIDRGLTATLKTVQRQSCVAIAWAAAAYAAALPHSSLLAIAAPSDSARSFAHMIEGWTRR